MGCLQIKVGRIPLKVIRLSFSGELAFEVYVSAAYGVALEEGKSFRECIDAMVVAAEAGMNSTRELRARIGRAARLGDRSIGVLDAGACSCFLILRSMGESITHLLDRTAVSAA